MKVLKKSVRGNFWARTSLSSLMAHIPWWLNFIAVGISLPFFCVISFDFNWSRSPKIQHPFALVCRCGLADIRRFVCADFRTDWDGSLEKWWWDAGTFSACKNFFHVYCLCRIFFSAASPMNEFFSFTQSFCFPVKLYLEETQPSVRHIQVLLPEVWLHCLFWCDN